jgi:hypothetical protein
MEPDCSLPSSQQPTTGLYSEPAKSNPYPRILFHEYSDKYCTTIYA